MAYDELLADRIREVVGTRKGLTERKMFGGLSFLHHGRMCCGIVGSDLMVRIVEAEFDAVMRRPHVRPMDFTGKPLRGFVYVAPAGFRTRATLKEWIERGRKAAEAKAANRRA
jgi:TfoX/Sxy family transcriptional regulator of competence genes